MNKKMKIIFFLVFIYLIIKCNNIEEMTTSLEKTFTIKNRPILRDPHVGLNVSLEQEDIAPTILQRVTVNIKQGIEYYPVLFTDLANSIQTALYHKIKETSMDVFGKQITDKTGSVFPPLHVDQNKIPIILLKKNRPNLISRSKLFKNEQRRHVLLKLQQRTVRSTGRKINYFKVYTKNYVPTNEIQTEPYVSIITISGNNNQYYNQLCLDKDTNIIYAGSRYPETQLNFKQTSSNTEVTRPNVYYLNQNNITYQEYDITISVGNIKEDISIGLLRLQNLY